MNRFLIVFLMMFLSLPVFAGFNEEFAIQDEAEIFYSVSNETWSFERQNPEDLVFKKNLIQGSGSYSRYLNGDGILVFALSTGCELLRNGKFIIVDNNLLKYSKLVYTNGSYQEVPLTMDEVQEAFPDAEILKISWIDEDNKIWLHKPLFKKRTILLVNDTDRYFHGLSCKSKKAQDGLIKGLITLSHYGFYKFKHFGERDGKLTLYVR